MNLNMSSVKWRQFCISLGAYLYLYLYLMDCICICICIWSNFCRCICICICIWNSEKNIFVFVFVFDKTYLTPALSTNERTNTLLSLKINTASMSKHPQWNLITQHLPGLCLSLVTLICHYVNLLWLMMYYFWSLKNSSSAILTTLPHDINGVWTAADISKQLYHT